VNWISLDWLHATGSKPTLTARNGAPGSFARLLAEILRQARVPTSNGHDHDRQGLAVETLNRLDAIRRRRLAEQSFRRILKPLRLKHDLVDEVRHLVELGEADVLRVGKGVDCDHGARSPAMIEFEEAGTISSTDHRSAGRPSPSSRSRGGGSWIWLSVSPGQMLGNDWSMRLLSGDAKPAWL
jgi:hypothetical protein